MHRTTVGLGVVALEEALLEHREAGAPAVAASVGGEGGPAGNGIPNLDVVDERAVVQRRTAAGTNVHATTDVVCLVLDEGALAKHGVTIHRAGDASPPGGPVALEGAVGDRRGGAVEDVHPTTVSVGDASDEAAGFDLRTATHDEHACTMSFDRDPDHLAVHDAGRCLVAVDPPTGE